MITHMTLKQKQDKTRNMSNLRQKSHCPVAKKGGHISKKIKQHVPVQKNVHIIHFDKICSCIKYICIATDNTQIPECASEYTVFSLVLYPLVSTVKLDMKAHNII